jgi:hypothetical protein
MTCTHFGLEGVVSASCSPFAPTTPHGLPVKIANRALTWVNVVWAVQGSDL